MKYSGYLAALAAVANAHTTIWNMYDDGTDLGVGNVAGGYIRYPPNNNPVKDITSADMTCNVANKANTLTKSVAAGSVLTLEWHHDSNSASDDIIAASHKGPVMVYIAPTSSNGAGDVWVKLAEDGYDASTKLWAVDKLITNKGKHTFTLPAALADGDYLIRGEIIALHESDAAYNVNSARGAQFYMECIQITVTGGGSTTLPAGVAIPGAYKYTDPGVVFNLYGSFTSYTIPGPAVWNPASSGSTTPVASSAAAVKPSSSAAAAPVASTKASTSAVATQAAAIPATSAAAPVATSAAAAPVVSASASKSACKAKTSSIATQAAVVATSAAAPVASASVSKSACKAKTSSIATQAAVVATSAAAPVASAPVSKSACKAKTTLQTVVRSSTAAGVVSPTGTVGSVALYGQCGGQTYKGATACASGTCTKMNDYYSQCV